MSFKDKLGINNGNGGSAKNNKMFIAITICGVLIFAIVAYIVISSTSTVTAVVPNQDITAGTKIEESMLETIEVPKNTPQGFITDKTSLVGQKLKVKVGEEQLLYINDVMSSWDDFSDGEKIPDDYVVTSIQLPSNRAVGGLITAGDTVDILGVPNNEYNTATKETLDGYLGEIANDSYGAQGMNVYWVLSNVKILETDSTLSQSADASISTVTSDDSNGNSSSTDGSFYIVALSYSDYKKLRLSEQYLDLWMNIAPAQNDENGPMLDEMREQEVKALQDAQAQSKMKEDSKNNEISSKKSSTKSSSKSKSSKK